MIILGALASIATLLLTGVEARALRRVDRGKPVNLRANLMHDNKVVSEPWSYILSAD